MTVPPNSVVCLRQWTHIWSAARRLGIYACFILASHQGATAQALIPLNVMVEACVMNSAHCVEAVLTEGADLNEWLAQTLPAEDHLAVTLRIAPGRFELKQGWLLDGKVLSKRVATLTILGDGAQRSILLGSVSLQRLAHHTALESGGVTKLSLIADADLTATPWDVRRDRPAYPMLFDAQGPWTLAHWPKAGWARIAEVKGVGADSTWQLTGNDADRLRDSNAWSWGFFRWNWYDEHLRFGAKSRYGTIKGARVRVLNARRDLRAPREFTIDAAAASLHLRLPAKGKLSDLRISRLKMPLLTLRNLSQVDVRDLGLAETRGNGISLDRVSSARLRSIAVRDVGEHGIVTMSSDHVSISDSDIERAGQGGVSLEGGDRNTLSVSSNRISGSRIRQVGSVIETASAAIKLSGVGASAIGNRILDVPHNAIFFEGNEHLMADNDIFGACQDTDDAGAIYAVADWTYRGNVIRGNSIAQVRNGGDSENLVGIYLDDMLSGTVVEENILSDMQRGVLVGGGRDNQIRNNLFVATTVPIHVDARALGWASASVAPGGALQQKLLAVPHSGTRWRAAYPALAALLASDAGAPANNQVEGNFSSNGASDEYAAEALLVSHLAPTKKLAGSASIISSISLVIARCRQNLRCKAALP